MSKNKQTKKCKLCEKKKPIEQMVLSDVFDDVYLCKENCNTRVRNMVRDALTLSRRYPPGMDHTTCYECNICKTIYPNYQTKYNWLISEGGMCVVLCDRCYINNNKRISDAGAIRCAIV